MLRRARRLRAAQSAPAGRPRVADLRGAGRRRRAGRLERLDLPGRRSTGPLFEDYRARLVGDSITVQIVEKISATQKSTSSIDKTGKLSAGITALPLRLAQLASTAPPSPAARATPSPAPGTTANSNEFTGTITAVVTGVLPNGHLLVAGEKQIGVNHNVDVLRFSGQVDPRMIQTGNVVAVGADRQRADRAARPRRPGRGAGNRLAQPLLFERSADLSAAKNRSSASPELRPCTRSIESCARRSLIAAFLASAAVWWPAPAQAARIKEVASVQGVRTNQLVGYGLVVGLDGTGDQTTQAPFATQSLLALLQQMGVTVPPGTNMQLKNLATVMVTAQLPAFAQPGQTIDVNVSSLANAKSLRGGTLIATPLKGADGQVYAMAQGNLVVGGAGASAAGSKVQINHLSAGRIPDGATVERASPTPMAEGDSIQLDLNSSDFAPRAKSFARSTRKMGSGIADALDGRVVRVRMPPSADARVAFMAEIENLDIGRRRRPPRS